MVRAVLEHGTVRLLSPVPGSWSDGQELVITEALSRDEVQGLEQWSREIDELASAIPAAEFDRCRARGG